MCCLVCRCVASFARAPSRLLISITCPIGWCHIATSPAPPLSLRPPPARYAAIRPCMLLLHLLPYELPPAASLRIPIALMSATRADQHALSHTADPHQLIHS
mmetsp:Transcript_48929/g.110107  ORF Transcript_48929/g.110107 Transcript_48929/m.110107 type:complete len:102 (-) Transcript_48929:898-1203(-)